MHRSSHHISTPKQREQFHEPATQHRPHQQPAHLAHPRRHGEAGRDRSRLRRSCIPPSCSGASCTSPNSTSRKCRCSSLMMATAAATSAGSACRSSPRAASFTPASWCGATPASRRRPTSRASASACRNISRPRRCGRAACCSTNSACAPQDMEFWMERTPERSHGGATGFKPPPGVTIAPDPGRQEHRLDDARRASSTRRCIYLSGAATSSTAARVDLRKPSRHQARSFPIRSPRASATIARPGSIPINHGMVVRREIAEKEPWVVLNLLKAFDARQRDRQRAAHRACRISPRHRPAARRRALDRR